MNHRVSLLQPNVQFPIHREIVIAPETFPAMQTKTGERHSPRIFVEHNAALLWHSVVSAVDAETVEPFTAPVENDLEDLVNLGNTAFAADQRSPPDQWTHAIEHGTKLIDRG